MLRDGLLSIAKELGVEKHFDVEGPAISLNYNTRNAEGELSADFRTLFAQEMVRHGVLMSWIAVSLSHTQKELEITLDAARKSLSTYAQALESGISQYLDGPAIKPVFRKYN